MNDSLTRKIWRVVYPALLLFGVYLAAYAAAALIYEGFFKGSFADLDSFMSDAGDIVSVAALCLGCAAAAAAYRADRVKESGRIVAKPLYIPAVIVFGVLAAHGISIAVSLVNLTGALGEYSQTEQMIEASGIVITAVKAVILAPVAEELVFRGLVFRRMEEYSSSFFAASAVSSLLFSLYHMNLLAGIYAFLYGILLCLIFRSFENIAAPVIMHAAANAFSLAASYLGIDYPNIPVYAAVAAAALIAAAAIYFLIIKKSAQRGRDEI